MRNILLTLFLLGATQLIAQVIPEIETIKIHSKELNQDREIYIYKPYYYDEYFLKHYDVMFVFDAHRKEYFNLANSLSYFIDKNDVNGEFIVVGIPANLKLDDYNRNDDFLPKPVYDEQNFFYGQANQKAFMEYVSNEVIPYIDNNYRTLKNRLAVGHSLGASFILSTLIQKPETFDNFIAVSPNFSYDRQRLANEFINFNFNKLKSQKFIYLSHADEDNYWRSWKPSRDKVYNHLNETKTQKIKYNISSFPDYDHLYSFLPALTEGLSKYYQYQKESAIETEVTVKVQVSNKEEDVFILGNHENLGSWDEEKKLKMTKISDFEREITIPLLPSAQIRFIGGKGEAIKEAIIKDYNLAEFFYIPISPEKRTNYNFEILGWNEY
jgi:predicted alpha/beta superfamily hydrolase